MLRPAADGPELTGRLEKRHDEGDVYEWFMYDVLRVWQRPMEAFLGDQRSDFTADRI